MVSGGHGWACYPTRTRRACATCLVANVEPSSRVITDGWSSYPKATRDLYEHKATSIADSGRPAHEVLPAVRRVFSLVKRWLEGTMQGSVSPEHVQAYLDEWGFRFTRRYSRSRGLLFCRLLSQAITGEVVRYKALRKTGRTWPAHHIFLPPREDGRPPSLEVGEVGLPWRCPRNDTAEGA